MKITHIDGKVVDTDKLPDVDAAILEKVEELRTLCQTANRLLYLVIDTNGSQKMTTFWNFKSDEDTSQEKMNFGFGQTMRATHSFIQHVTNDNLGIYPTEALDEEKWERLSQGNTGDSDTEN